MTQVRCFNFSPFQENTYLLYDASHECVIIDPGCWSPEEQQTLEDAITRLKLRPVRHLLTHGHLDHVFGSAWVHRTYGLLPECHEGERVVLERSQQTANGYGIPMEAPPMPENYLSANTFIEFGETKLRLLFVPGHSPASLAFYCAESGFVIAGDTLFRDSIGRTDFPGGHHQTLLDSIKQQLFTLPDDTIVYSGHGDSTNIGREKRNNPFLK